MAESVKQEFADFLAEGKNATAIAAPGAERDRFLEVLDSASEGYASPNEVVDFLAKAIEPIWQNARKRDGFEYYDEYLQVLIAVLEKVQVTATNPTVVHYLADALNEAGYYFDAKKSSGSAHNMSDTWVAKGPSLNRELLHELRDFAETNDLAGLLKMLKCAALKGVFTK